MFGVKSDQKEDREIGKVGQNDGGREKVKQCDRQMVPHY